MLLLYLATEYLDLEKCNLTLLKPLKKEKKKICFLRPVTTLVLLLILHGAVSVWEGSSECFWGMVAHIWPQNELYYSLRCELSFFMDSLSITCVSELDRENSGTDL